MNEILPGKYPYPETLKSVMVFSAVAGLLLLVTFFLALAVIDEAQPMFLLASILCISVTLIAVSLGIVRVNQDYRKQGGEGYLLPGKFFNMRVRDAFSYWLNLGIYSISGAGLAVISVLTLIRL